MFSIQPFCLPDNDIINFCRNIRKKSLFQGILLATEQNRSCNLMISLYCTSGGHGSVTAARDLDVMIDSQHVAALSRQCYFHLRQIIESTRTSLKAFVASHLDYCNSLLYSISDGLLHRLQLVQNAAAHVITGARQCAHITPRATLAITVRLIFCLSVFLLEMVRQHCPVGFLGQTYNQL